MVKCGCKFTGWAFGVLKKRGLTFMAGLIFAVLCFVAINAAMKPVSTSEYCGTKCHEMDTAYKSWQASVHGVNERGLRSECINCHLQPKEEYFTHLTAKGLAGARDIYKHHFGGEYDIEKMQEKALEHVSNERCLHCHVDLLAKPSSDDIKETHAEVLNPSEDEEYKCTECHDDAGHQR